VDVDARGSKVSVVGTSFFLQESQVTWTPESKKQQQESRRHQDIIPGMTTKSTFLGTSFPIIVSFLSLVSGSETQVTPTILDFELLPLFF
jgi:hypothetical protein